MSNSGSSPTHGHQTESAPTQQRNVYAEEDTSQSNWMKQDVNTTPAPDMSLHSFPTESFDEYDPVNPNDYEAIAAERERRKRDEKARREMQRQMEAKERERQRLREEREKREMTGAAGRGRGRGIDLRPEWLKKQQEQEQQSSKITSDTSSSSSMAGVQTQDSQNQEAPQFGVAYGRGGGRGRGADKPKGMEFAAKLMQSWGYEEGKGLGRDESGITAPLEHEKVGSVHGRIRNPDEEPDTALRAAPPNASRIVMLQV